MTYKFIDCQGFAGGMAVGATQAGFQLVHKVEKRGGFGLPLMDANRAFLGEDWGYEVGDPETDWEPTQADVVVGTPPCAAFSGMTFGTSKHGIDSSINECMWDLTRYAARVRPAVMVMESVSQAYTKGVSLMTRLAEELNHLTGLWYTTTHVLQNNLSVGGCTNRKRYFLVLSQVPFGVERPTVDRVNTLGDALADLTSQPLDWAARPYVDPATAWSKPLRRDDQHVDGHAFRENTFTKRLADIHAGAGWAPGEREADILKRHYELHGALPESYQYPQPGASGLTRDKHLLERGFDPGGFNQTRCWSWANPGRVLSGAGVYMVWHPNGRVITNREAARIMGFPDAWLIEPVKDDPQLSSYWGKGTSVAPARWVMDWVRESLNGNPGSVTGDLIETGARLIDVSHEWKTALKPQVVS
jgi:site-specific DNA-cytosine methylase